MAHRLGEISAWGSRLCECFVVLICSGGCPGTGLETGRQADAGVRCAGTGRRHWIGTELGIGATFAPTVAPMPGQARCRPAVASLVQQDQRRSCRSLELSARRRQSDMVFPLRRQRPPAICSLKCRPSNVLNQTAVTAGLTFRSSPGFRWRRSLLGRRCARNSWRPMEPCTWRSGWDCTGAAQPRVAGQRSG